MKNRLDCIKPLQYKCSLASFIRLSFYAVHKLYASIYPYNLQSLLHLSNANLFAMEDTSRQSSLNVRPFKHIHKMLCRSCPTTGDDGYFDIFLHKLNELQVKS